MSLNTKLKASLFNKLSKLYDYGFQKKKMLFENLKKAIIFFSASGSTCLNTQLLLFPG